MNQSINTDSKNSKEPQQKYRLGTVNCGENNVMVGCLGRSGGGGEGGRSQSILLIHKLLTQYPKHYM